METDVSTTSSKENSALSSEEEQYVSEVCMKHMQGKCRIDAIIAKSDEPILDTKSVYHSCNLKMQLRAVAEMKSRRFRITRHFSNPDVDDHGKIEVINNPRNKEVNYSMSIQIISENNRNNLQKIVVYMLLCGNAYYCKSTHFSNDAKSLCIVVDNVPRITERLKNSVIVLSAWLLYSPCSLYTSPSVIFENKFASDFALITRDGVTINLHKCMLYERSEYFRKMFDSGMIETDSKSLSVPEDDADPMSFVLKFLYGECKIEFDMPVERLLAIMKCADKYGEVRLHGHICNHLRKRVTAENVLQLLKTAHAGNIHTFKDWCFDFIISHGIDFDALFPEETFQEMDSDLAREIFIKMGECIAENRKKRKREEN